MIKAAGRKHNVPGLLVVCGAFLLLCAHDAAAQRGGPAPCRDGQLSASKFSEDAAMGGARMAEYALTNTSQTACTLKGYPRFEVLTASGRLVRRGRPDAEQRPDLVTIGPGKAATFSVSYNAGGAGRVGRPCPTYPKVRITAPGLKRGRVLREPLQSCGELKISPIGPPSGEQP